MTLTLRQRIARGAGLFGPFLTLPAPMAVEIACASGADFVCIDLEHGPISPETLENMLRAAAVHRLPALVRVPAPDAAAVGLALDCGAEGVLVPRVSTAAEARDAVAAARFPPEGRRGAGPGRAAGYGRDIAAHLDAARGRTVVAVQIETEEALRNLDAILAVPGIDLAFIGPGDLAVSLAAAGSPLTLAAAIDSVLDGAAAAGVPAGIFVMTRAEAAAHAGRVALTICGSDATILIAGFAAQFPRRAGAEASAGEGRAGR